MQPVLLFQLPPFIKSLLLMLLTGLLLSISVGLLLYMLQTNTSVIFHYIALLLTASGATVGIYKLLKLNKMMINVSQHSGFFIAAAIATISMLILFNIQQVTLSLQEVFILSLASTALGMPFKNQFDRKIKVVDSEN